MLRLLQKIDLTKFKKKNLLIIWGCEKCGKIMPFYKSGNDLIDTIYLCWARDHQYCRNCEEPKIKVNNLRISKLLKFYENKENDEEEWNLDILNPL